MTGKSDSGKGLIMVYTGDGKGKTTAAIGQAVRMMGHGWKVLMVHFMKGRDYGEFFPLIDFPGVTIVKGGRDEFVCRENPDPYDVELARNGFAEAQKAIYGGEYDMVVLDEINVALDFGLLELDDVMEVLQKKPEKVDVVLTGRNASPQIIEIADMVSEVKEIKHHYQKGVVNRKGIEF